MFPKQECGSCFFWNILIFLKHLRCHVKYNLCPFLQRRGWSRTWGWNGKQSPTLQERRVVMHYVTTLPQRKGPEEQNAIGFAAAVGEPTGWRGVGCSWDEMYSLVCPFCSMPANCKFDWRLFWARLDGLFGLETFGKSLQPTLGRYEWCISCILIGRQAASAKSRFEIIYTLNPPAKYQQSKQKLPFSRGYLWRLFHRETVFFHHTTPSQQPPDECLRESQVLALGFAPGYFAFEKRKGGEEAGKLAFFGSREIGYDSRKKQHPTKSHSVFFWLLVVFSWDSVSWTSQNMRFGVEYAFGAFQGGTDASVGLCALHFQHQCGVKCFGKGGTCWVSIDLIPEWKGMFRKQNSWYGVINLLYVSFSWLRACFCIGMSTLTLQIWKEI